MSQPVQIYTARHYDGPNLLHAWNFLPFLVHLGRTTGTPELSTSPFAYCERVRVRLDAQGRIGPSTLPHKLTWYDAAHSHGPRGCPTQNIFGGDSRAQLTRIHDE